MSGKLYRWISQRGDGAELVDVDYQVLKAEAATQSESAFYQRRYAMLLEQAMEAAWAQITLHESEDDMTRDILREAKAEAERLRKENDTMREAISFALAENPDRDDWCHGDAYTRMHAAEECPGCVAYNALRDAMARKEG